MGPSEQLVVLTNTSTGETVEYLLDQDHADAMMALKAGPKKKARPRVKYTEPYALVFAEGARRMASNRDLKMTDHRIVWALLATAPIHGGWFRAERDQLAATAGVPLREVTRSLTVLVRAGILVRPKRGWLMFDPECFWKGTAESREAFLAQKIASASGTEEGEDHG